MTNDDATGNRLGEICCELGEGPHYDALTDTAWWFDILGCKLIEYRFAAEITRVHQLPRMASVVAAIDPARQLLAMEDGFYLRQKSTGDLTLLAPLEADNPATRSNDGRVHPSGSLWVGTMGKRAEERAGSIYWFDGDEVRRLFSGISIPNSICFSADGETGYFSDTRVNRVWRVRLDAASGLPRGEPENFLQAADLPHGGGFDGSVVDADGVLWNAAFGSGAVSGFAADGSLVKSIRLPASQVTCPCFVGQGFGRMLVTSAWEGYDAPAREADPGAGFSYLLDAPFRGVADPRFKLADGHYA